MKNDRLKKFNLFQLRFLANQRSGSPRQVTRTFQARHQVLRRFQLRLPVWNPSRRVRQFLSIVFTSFLLTLGVSGIHFDGIPTWGGAPAVAQTSSLYIEPLTWDFIGLDSNNVNVGPNNYLNGARVCNIGSSVATNVNVQFVRDGATNPYITVRALAEARADTIIIPQLQPGSTPLDHHKLSGTPSNCFDAYFNVVVARNSAAYNTTQKYHIEASASNAGMVRTPINRQLYIEKILSQARNNVISFTGPSSVSVGDTATYTLTATTSTAYPQLTISSDFPNAVFQFLDISTSYSNPGGTNSSVYADACGWLADYTTPGYHESASVCDGPVPDQYTGGKVGNTVVTKYKIKILSTGNGSASNTFNVNHLILDFSGGSYHYNADYGTGLGVTAITVSDRQADLSIDKSHSGNFTPGDNVYTLTVQNNGNTIGAEPTAKAPIIVTDTLPTGYSYVGLDTGTSAGWTCSASGQTVTCTNSNDLLKGATSTIKLRVNVSTSTAANTVNTASVQSSSTDPNLANNTDNDPTLLILAANLQLTKSDGSPDPTGNAATNNNPSVVVGSNVTYSFTVNNLSTAVAAAQPIILTDTLPTGLMYSSFTGTNWTCSAEGQNVTCTYNQNIAAGGSAAPLSIVTSTNSGGIPSGTSAVIKNTATVSSQTLDSDSTNNTSQDDFTLTKPVSDLTITKIDYDATFVAGAFGSYNITIENKGVAPTTGNIEIRETLPIGVYYNNHSGIGSDGLTAITWTCKTGIPATTTDCATGGATNGSTTVTTPLTFTYAGVLAPGQKAQLNLSVKAPTTVPTAGTTITNTATVYNANDGTTQLKTEPESTPVVASANNAQTNLLSVTKKLTKIGTLAPSPVCTTAGITGTPGAQIENCSAGVTPGQDIEYQVAVTNSTSAGPDGVTLNLFDFLPTELNITSVTCQITGAGSGGNTNTDCDSATAGVQGTAPSTSGATLTVVDNTVTPPKVRINPPVVIRKGGGQVTFTFKGNLKTSDQLGTLTSLTNTAQIPSTDGTNVDSNPTDNTASTTFPINRTDLAITKTDGNASFAVGVDGTYTLTVSNVSANPTVGKIIVTDDLPDSFNFQYGTSAPGSSGWVCSLTNATTKVVTCSNDGPIPAGGQSQIQLIVQPTPATGSPFTNLAQVTTSGDTTTSNNGNAPGTTTPNTTYGYDTTPVIAPSVDLQITKTLTGGTSLNVGQTATYQIGVVNLGPTVATASTAAPIRVTDTLPTGLSFVSATGAGWSCTVSGQTVTCDRTTNLGISQPSTITLNVFVDPTAPSSVTNIAQVAQHVNESAANNVLNNNSSSSRNNFSLTSTVNPSADLAIAKTLVGNLVAGQNATYQLKVTNNGPSNVSNTVTITDTLPTGLTFVPGSGGGFSCSVSGQIVTCSNPAGLAAGSSATIPLTVTVASSATGSINNSATVSSGVTDSDSSNNTSSTGAIAVGLRQADLGLTKTHFGTFAIGGQGTFTLEVKNYGPATVTGPITITDTLPSALTLASFVGQDWNCSGINTANASCTYSNPNGLAPNATTAVDIIVNVGTGTSTGSRTNTASVSSNIPEPSPDPHPNTATDTFTVQTSADLSVTKTTSSSFVVGNTATYTLRITNNGAGTAASPITLIDQLPTGLTYAGANSSDTNWSCPASSSDSDITCTYNASLAAGASTGNLSLTVNVANLGSSNPSNYTNFVTVYSSTQDPNFSNNTTSITTARSTVVANRDFGDAPDTYGTDATAGNSSSGNDSIGASHTLSTSVFMGSTATDAESDASAQLNGTGDDTTGADDENGVSSFPALTTTATTYSVTVTVTNTSGSNASLIGWIDFNRDGFFQTSEGTSVTVATGTAAAPVSLTWSNLGNAGMTAGTTYARFRLTTDGTITTNTPAGQGGVGEVEDYQLAITSSATGPNVLLVKRITAIKSGGTTTNFTTVFDPASTVSDVNDGDSKWPTGFLRGGGVTDANPSPVDPVRAFKLKPGDEVEYTVYFLNAGAGNAQNLVICDRVPANQTFVANSFNGQTPNDGGLAPDQQGIALAIGPTAPSFSDTITYLSNVPDAPDRGEFFTTPNLPSPNRCNVTNNSNGLVVVATTRTTGPTIIPPATGTGTPASSYGFIRFRAKVN